MQKRIIRLITLLVLLMAGAFVAFLPLPAQAQDGPPAEEASAHLADQSKMPIPPFIPGVVLVGLRGDAAAVSSADASSGLWGDVEVLGVEPLDVRGGEMIMASGGEAEPEASATGLTGYKLAVPAGTEWEAISILTARSDVVFAEPDWLAQIAQNEPDRSVTETPFAVADTLYEKQWYLQRIGMSRAWSLAMEESGGNLSTVDVFVIDTGVDSSHPDLADVLTTGHNYVDNLQPPYDDNGHGTHISGLVAAAMNSAGMVGGGLQVRITPFKALDGNGTGGVGTIGQAIRDAADQGADIINLSLEISIDTFQLRSAVQYAVAKGVLVVAASGNQGGNDDPSRGIKGVSYPAAYPSVLAVGATTYFDARAYYSNRGADLDLVAPGGNSGHSILSSWTRDFGARCPSNLREVDGGLYCEEDGTSMSTGVVSGVAALIMSLRPDLDADQVQEILRDTAAPIDGTADAVGSGRIDAAKAVRLAIPPRLVYGEDAATVSSLQGADVFTVTLSLTNPSLQPLNVTVTPTITTTWYTIVGPRTGEVSYGSPLNIQLVFTPTANVSTLTSSIRVSTTLEGEGTTFYFVNTRLNVYPTTVGDTRLYMPWASTEIASSSWAVADFTPRISHTIASDGSIVVALPFTMTVHDRAYTDLRIFADGFAVASGSAFPPNQPNHCLDNELFPSFSVYGWWSYLSLDANSSLSTFQPDASHFAIEYRRFVSMGSSDPDDRVSFQIVLSRNGEITLNYDQVPEHAPASITVGASVADGRFYNQITCRVAGATQLGEVPQAHQTFVLHREDLY
jgi:subtilisin family serine protease